MPLGPMQMDEVTDGRISELLSMNLSSLSLFVATPEQVVESRRRTFESFGNGMTVEEYLQRDALSDEQEHAHHGKLLTWRVYCRLVSVSNSTVDPII